MDESRYHFVLDCSITMAWCFEDESNNYTDTILENLKVKSAIVPTIWSLEVANLLLLANRKNRISEIQTANFFDALSILPIITDSSTSQKALHSIFVIAKKTNLTIYDAAYLELAIREKIPLLTLDKDLIAAAKKLHIVVNPKI